MDFLRFKDAVESIRRVKPNGVEYWLARELQSLLGYKSWQSFEQLIERALKACERTRYQPARHFMPRPKMVSIGSGARKDVGDLWLSRIACYLIAINGDPSQRPEIGWAQLYFVVQTRRQEVFDEIASQLARIEKRKLVASHVTILSEIAKRCGVEHFGLFHDEGNLGLYTMRAKELRVRKNLPENANHLDFAGFTELAAYDLRTTLAAEQLARRGVNSQHEANKIHRETGENVREAVIKSGSLPPEDLPVEPHIKRVEKGLQTRSLPLFKIVEN